MPNSDTPEARGRPAPPQPVPITPERGAAIAAAVGVPGARIEPVDSIGIINTVYRLGDHLVLRVPRDHPAHAAQARREALAIPAAVRAGVRTPRLVHVDDSATILPVPFLVVERVDGENAESLGVVPPRPRSAWLQLGADLGRLHGCRTPPPPGDPWPIEDRDPHQLVELRAGDGWISPLEARQLHAWLDRLAPLVSSSPPVFLHGDLQMSNVLLDRATKGYRALIDWGGARSGDAVEDFTTVPLATVGPLLEGYREVLPATPLTEASILWRRLQLVLQLLPRGAAPSWAWGERPVARWTDMLLFFQHMHDAPWHALGPAAGPLRLRRRRRVPGRPPRRPAAT